jgi:hypothetical protein
MNGQFHAAAALLPGKQPPYSLSRRLGGPRAGLDSVLERRISCLARNRTLVVQSLAISDTDWTVPTPPLRTVAQSILSPYLLRFLSPIVIAFQVKNAFSSLGHKACISVTKLSKITVDIRKISLFSSMSYVQLFMFQILQPCFLYLTKCGNRTIKNKDDDMASIFSH